MLPSRWIVITLEISQLFIQYFGLWPNTWKTSDIPISLSSILCLVRITKCLHVNKVLKVKVKVLHKVSVIRAKHQHVSVVTVSVLACWCCWCYRAALSVNYKQWWPLHPPVCSSYSCTYSCKFMCAKSKSIHIRFTAEALWGLSMSLCLVL